MSFILGCFGNNIDKYKSKINSFNLSANFKFENESYFILADGLKETCVSGNIDNNTNFISVGLGISKSNEKLKFLQSNDWRNILQKSSDEEILDLNGHFVTLIFSKERLIAFSDSLGMRELYYFIENENIIFSTRTDFLTKIKGENSLNIDEFGSVWLMNFQLNFKSALKGIDRLGPGGKLIFQNNKLHKSNNPWKAELKSAKSESNFISELKRFTIFPIENDQKMSLALSGGLDSRLLFSIFTSQKNSWSLHTLGENVHPDVKLANKIADHFNKEIENYLPETISAEKVISMLENFFKQTPPIIPAYEILNANLNKNIYDNGKFIIDGCCGEIFRRQYLLGLAVKGKKSLLDFNPSEIMNFLTGFKADIFSDDVNMQMQKSSLSDIYSIKNIMPDVTKENINDWLDLFSIIYKMPNVFSPLQAFTDSISVDYIPFVQKDILNLNFEIPLELRKNGKLFKNFIKHNSPELSKIPLVKNNVNYPFNFGSIAQRLILRLNNRFGKVYNSGIDQTFLYLLKDYIYDQINSVSFNNFQLYDKNKIKKITDEFYDGNKNLTMQVNWFLSFETWRKFNLTE